MTASRLASVSVLACVLAAAACTQRSSGGLADPQPRSEGRRGCDRDAEAGAEGRDPYRNGERERDGSSILVRFLSDRLQGRERCKAQGPETVDPIPGDSVARDTASVFPPRPGPERGGDPGTAW